MASFLILLAAATTSALPQFRPTFQNFPQQFSGFQLPQRPFSNFGSFPNLGFQPNLGSLQNLFNPSQLIGGQASLPPWLRPKTDATKGNVEDAPSSRLIDNTDDAAQADEVVPVNVDAAQKAYEDYLKLCLTTGYGTSGGYTGSYSRPVTGYTSGYSSYPSGYTSGYTTYPSYTNIGGYNGGYTGGYNGGYNGGYTGGYNGGYNYPIYSSNGYYG